MFKTIEGLTYDFKGDLFIDIGANIGMWSTQLVDLYNRIIYIEPGIDALTTGKIQLAEICRQKNIPFENITFLKNVCARELGKEFTLYGVTADDGNFSIFTKDLYGEQTVKKTEEKVPTITLDSLESQVGTAKDIFVKIDTEGCDLDILLGGFNFIMKFKPTVFVEAHFHMYFDQNKWNTILNFMHNQGYECKEFKSPGYISNPDHIYTMDGKYSGRQMYDLHYQMIFLPT